MLTIVIYNENEKGVDAMKFYTAREAASILGLAEGTVRNMISNGKIKNITILGTKAVRVPQEEINRLTGKEEK